MALALLVFVIVDIAYPIRLSFPSSSNGESAPVQTNAHRQFDRSSTFNVMPNFKAASTTVAGFLYDAIEESVKVALTPSLQGFTLVVRVQAHYSPTDIADLTSSKGSSYSPIKDVAKSCVEFQIPPSDTLGDNYTETPLRTSLTISHGTVTGTLTYAGIVPSTYYFDFTCLGSDQVRVPRIGKVMTSNWGVSSGSSSASDNAFVVYAVHKSATSTVIMYGAIGGTRDGSFPAATSTCVNPAKSGKEVVWPPSESVHGYVSSNSEWYETGILTFDLSPEEIGRWPNNATLAYGCPHGTTYNNFSFLEQINL